MLLDGDVDLDDDDVLVMVTPVMVCVLMHDIASEPSTRNYAGSQLRAKACCKMRSYTVSQENLVQVRLETITYIPSGLLTGALLSAFGSTGVAY